MVGERLTMSKQEKRKREKNDSYFDFLFGVREFNLREREHFIIYSQYIARRNLFVLKNMTRTLSAVFIILTAFTPVFFSKWRASAIYLIEFCILILSFYTSVVLEKQKDVSQKVVNRISVGFCAIAMTGLIGIELVNKVATFFPLALIIIPTLFIFRSLTYVILIGVLETIFVVAEVTQKSQEVWRNNVYISLVAIIFSSIVAFSVSHKRVNDAKEMDRLWKQSARNLYGMDGTRGTLSKEVTGYLMNKNINTICALYTVNIIGLFEVKAKYGRDYGDEILASIGRILKYSFRVGDVVGFVGDYEFTVFLKEISDLEFLEAKKQEVQKKLEQITYPDGEKLQYRIKISVYEKECEIE